MERISTSKDMFNFIKQEMLWQLYQQIGMWVAAIATYRAMKSV